MHPLARRTVGASEVMLEIGHVSVQAELRQPRAWPDPPQDLHRPEQALMAAAIVGHVDHVRPFEVGQPGGIEWRAHVLPLFAPAEGAPDGQGSQAKVDRGPHRRLAADPKLVRLKAFL